MNLLKEYDSWLLTDCDKSIPKCERAPASWILSTRPLICMDQIANLGWHGGEITTEWDYLKGERYDADLLRKITGGKEVIAVRESERGVNIVGFLD